MREDVVQTPAVQRLIDEEAVATRNSAGVAGDGPVIAVHVVPSKCTASRAVRGVLLDRSVRRAFLDVDRLRGCRLHVVAHHAVSI